MQPSSSISKRPIASASRNFSFLVAPQSTPWGKSLVGPGQEKALDAPTAGPRWCIGLTLPSLPRVRGRNASRQGQDLPKGSSPWGLSSLETLTPQWASLRSVHLSVAPHLTPIHTPTWLHSSALNLSWPTRQGEQAAANPTAKPEPTMLRDMIGNLFPPASLQSREATWSSPRCYGTAHLS